MALDPKIASLLSFIESAGWPQVAESTPEQARMGLRALMVDFRDPDSLVPVASVQDGTVADDLPVRVYRSAVGGPPKPTIVFLHGGGWVIGDLDTHDNVCRTMSRDVDATVVSVDYPLAPEHPFPAAVDASYRALTWVAEHPEEFDGDGRIVVAGDSAGGNLAAVAAQQAHRDGHELAAQLLIYPAVDLLGTYSSRHENADGYFLTLRDMEWFAAHYTGVRASLEHARADPDIAAMGRDPRLSPLLAESLAGLPPAVVVTAEFDPLRDEGNRYAAALAEAGVTVRHREFAGLIHGFCGLEMVSPAIAAAMTWINGQLRELLQ